MTINLNNNQPESISKMEQLIETIKSNMQGENLSVRGTASLCGVADTSIIRGGAFKSVKLTQKLTDAGFEGAALVVNNYAYIYSNLDSFGGLFLVFWC